MPLLGSAAMLLSFDIVPPEHDDWHTHEPLPERLSIPGFLRGTRWVAARRLRLTLWWPLVLCEHAHEPVSLHRGNDTGTCRARVGAIHALSQGVTILLALVLAFKGGMAAARIQR